MKKYQVVKKIIQYNVLDVAANSEREAIEKAERFILQTKKWISPSFSQEIYANELPPKAVQNTSH